MRLVFAFFALWVGCLVPSLPAIDIDPSRSNAPNNNTNPSGNQFSVFSGDPDRIQKANSIDFKDFTTTLTLTPSSLHLAAVQLDPSGANNVKLTFVFKNIGKRTYTLSFPNSQRYEITIKNPANQLVYQWSLDKKFVDEVGTVMVNPTDRIGYSETLSFNTGLYAPLEVGTYTVEVKMANYPEITAKATFPVER